MAWYLVFVSAVFLTVWKIAKKTKGHNLDPNGMPTGDDFLKRIGDLES
tara:strand:+ start:194 stop:337 length:144 start_codon:yes stop_codon:yes gene_type:complete